MKELPSNLYNLWEDDKEFRQLRGNIELDDVSMNDSCIWSHTHRMYLIGSNSINFPWFIPKDFPRDALKKSDKEIFCKFIDDINLELKFTTCQKYFYTFLSIVFPPISSAYHFSVRKSKF